MSTGFLNGSFHDRFDIIVGHVPALRQGTTEGGSRRTTGAAQAVESRRQTAIAEAVNGFLNNDLLAAVARSAARGQGKDVTMRQVLDVAGERIDRASQSSGQFASEPLVEAAVRVTLGHTYRELGAYAAAEPHLRRAVELRRGALGADHPDTARVMINSRSSTGGRAASIWPSRCIARFTRAAGAPSATTIPIRWRTR